MDQLLKQLPTELRLCHDQILTARHKEVAHHDWPRQGKVLASAVFDLERTGIVGIRLRLFPIMGPEVDPPLAALVSQLATLVDLKMQQLQQRIVFRTRCRQPGRDGPTARFAAVPIRSIPPDLRHLASKQ